MTFTVDELRAALNRLRLERGWGYERLAAAVGPGVINGRTLRRFIDGETEPRETTLYFIEKYVRANQVAA